MDGYQDIYPWPYEWSRDINGGPISELALYEFLFDGMDVWTYHNHWSLHGWHDGEKDEWITDIYWSFNDEYRLQLPIDVGNILAIQLVEHQGPKMLDLLWNHQRWREDLGWQTYTGPQGDFVDHIHIEWKEYVWEDD